MAAVNIQIDIPNLGTYEMEELKHKLTTYARNLIAESNKNKSQQVSQDMSFDEDSKYSARLNRLRKLCGRVISAQEIQEDDRLAYLIGK